MLITCAPTLQQRARMPRVVPWRRDCRACCACRGADQFGAHLHALRATRVSDLYGPRAKAKRWVPRLSRDIFWLMHFSLNQC